MVVDAGWMVLGYVWYGWWAWWTNDCSGMDIFLEVGSVEGGGDNIFATVVGDDMECVAGHVAGDEEEKDGWDGGREFCESDEMGGKEVLLESTGVCCCCCCCCC